jgi:putative NIF3 family GTP cyclohydrolase 1 type 2
LNKIKERHPINQIAFEILSLENKHKTGTGLGRIFKVEETMSFEEYIKFVKEKLDLDFVKIVKANDNPIKKIAVVNGSGAEFWKKAYDMGADVFITGDFKYHNALDAFEKGLNIIDIGHYEAEHFFNEIIIKKLDDNLRVEVYNEKRILEIK